MALLVTERLTTSKSRSIAQLEAESDRVPGNERALWLKATTTERIAVSTQIKHWEIIRFRSYADSF